MLNETLNQKALERVAEAILKDPRSEITIRAHYQLAANTEDDIQMSIFLKILKDAVKAHRHSGDIEDIIQEKYLEYIKNTSPNPIVDNTRPRRYIDGLPEGNIPEVCVILY